MELGRSGRTIEAFIARHLDGGNQDGRRGGRDEIGLLIGEVVHNWDARTVSDRLELVLGSDLQYVRINGSIVGALVGVRETANPKEWAM